MHRAFFLLAVMVGFGAIAPIEGVTSSATAATARVSSLRVSSLAHSTIVPPDSVRDERSVAKRVAALEAESERLKQAQAESDRLQFSGQLFTRYGWNTTNTGAAKNFNSFSLDRWYFTVKGQLTEALQFRGTTDVVPAQSEAGLGYTVIVKYAYFDWQMRPWLALRAGVHQTGWENYVNGVWGYRGIAKTMAHRQDHLSTSDLGATLTASLPSEWGYVSVGIHNGQGYRNLETDRFKDVSGRAVLSPFAAAGGALQAVQVGGHVYCGQYSDGTRRLRWGGLVAYNGARYTLALNYELRKDGDLTGAGVSAFGTMNLGAVPALRDFSLVGLVDVYDPSGAAGLDRQVRSVVGLAYQPTEALTFSLDYQQDHRQAPVFDRYDGTLTDTDAGLFLHVIVTY